MTTTDTTNTAQPYAPVTASSVQQQVVFPPLTPAGFKDLGATYLLALFFGTLGVHKFYLGRAWLGVLYIFTFGMPKAGRETWLGQPALRCPVSGLAGMGNAPRKGWTDAP